MMRSTEFEKERSANTVTILLKLVWAPDSALSAKAPVKALAQLGSVLGMANRLSGARDLFVDIDRAVIAREAARIAVPTPLFNELLEQTPREDSKN